MHIFFSGIGGTAIGPLAMIAQQAGYTVSGSDKQDSAYIAYLRNHGIHNIHIGQSDAEIRAAHAAAPIDWYVYSSAVAIENPDAPELAFCREQNIHMSKRDELLNKIIQDKQLKLIAIAGTHGKTTTTALAIWLFQRIGVPVSYSVGAKIPFGEMGHFDPNSEYFVYECDEFDRNFLAFHPYASIITGVTWDHHEIFPTREDYKQAFRDFLQQSDRVTIWEEDRAYLAVDATDAYTVLNPEAAAVLGLAGEYNRRDAWLAVQTLNTLTNVPVDTLSWHCAAFPGLSRRMEQIAPNVYSDYAHTPEKIRGAMSVAREKAAQNNQDFVVVYEPLTNRRQHYMIDDYGDCFQGAKHVYWIPSYLAREDPNQRVIPPAEMISHLADPSIAEARERDASLAETIRAHANNGDMVVCIAGGGGGSLDEWVREQLR